MSVRFSLLLMAIGAAVSLLVDHQSQGVSVQVVGIAFLAGGALGLALALLLRIVRGPKRRQGGPAEAETASEQRRESVLQDRF